MTLLRRAGIGICSLFLALGSSCMAARAQAQMTHSIDWYVEHPVALQNAIVHCNTATGLIGTQDCRNAIVAAHIIATRPAQPAGNSN